MGKNQRTRHISKAISPTDFILGTKVQPNKPHSMTQVPMTLTLGQGQRSRSKFSQNGLNTKQLATSLMLFHPQTLSYLLSQLFVTHLGVALLFIYLFIYLFMYLFVFYLFFFVFFGGADDRRVLAIEVKKMKHLTQLYDFQGVAYLRRDGSIQTLKPYQIQEWLKLVCILKTFF